MTQRVSLASPPRPRTRASPAQARSREALAIGRSPLSPHTDPPPPPPARRSHPSRATSHSQFPVHSHPSRNLLDSSSRWFSSHHRKNASPQSEATLTLARRPRRRRRRCHSSTRSESLRRRTSLTGIASRKSCATPTAKRPSLPNHPEFSRLVFVIAKKLLVSSPSPEEGSLSRRSPSIISISIENLPSKSCDRQCAVADDGWDTHNHRPPKIPIRLLIPSAQLIFPPQERARVSASICPIHSRWIVLIVLALGKRTSRRREGNEGSQERRHVPFRIISPHFSTPRTFG